MFPKKTKPRFRYTEKQWEKIIASLKIAGFKNKSSFVRSRVQDIHISIMNNPSLFYIGNKKQYSIQLDNDTYERILHIQKHTGQSACYIIKTLILDPLLRQY